MDGEVVDRRLQHLALIRRYLMEREFSTVNMEINMRRQVREIGRASCRERVCLYV